MASSEFVHVAYDKLLNSYIPFDTASDALLANVALGLERVDMSNIVINVFDAMVNAICSPSFVREELSVKRFWDIQLHVDKERLKALRLAERRAADAVERRRSSPNDQLQVTASASKNPICTPIYFAEIPFVAFQCLLDYLDELLDFFLDKELDYTYAYEYSIQQVATKPLRNLLSSMSLVHPTWTLPVRRVLGRFAVLLPTVDNHSSLNLLLRNPGIGEWAHHLRVVMRDDHKTFRLASESLRYPVLLSKLPNVQTLSFEIPLYLHGFTNILPMDGLRNLKTIRVLLSNYCDFLGEKASEFFQSFSNVQDVLAIESFHVFGVADFGYGPSLPATLQPLTTIKSLSKIHVTSTNDKYATDYGFRKFQYFKIPSVGHCLAWLVRFAWLVWRQNTTSYCTICKGSPTSSTL